MDKSKEVILFRITTGGIMKMYKDYSKYLFSFKIEDNKVYIYDLYKKEEYRNYIEVKKINGISIKKLLKKGLTKEDLLDPKRLKKYGIDVTKNYKLKLDGYGTYNIPKQDESNIDFEIPHKKSKVLKIRKSKKFQETEKTDNTMLDYASTSYKSMLNMLLNLSKSPSDINLFESLITDIKTYNDNFNQMNTAMNIAYLSTAVLLEDENYSYIPYYIIDKFRNPKRYGFNIFKFIDEENMIEENSAVVTNGYIDIRKIIIMTRNAIAHSNYEVINDNYIRVFNEGKNKLNLLMPIDLLLYTLIELNGYHTLYGFYPTVTKEYNEIEAITQETIDEFLSNLKIHMPNKIVHEHTSPISEYLDENLKLNILNAKQELNYLVFEETHKEIFKKYFEQYLSPVCHLLEINIDESLKQYIKDYIEMTDSDYFYNVISRSSQEEIIANIIRQRIDKKNSYFKQIESNIKDNKELNLSSLNYNSRSYINYIPQIELTILTLLNIFFCYAHNHNKRNIDTTSIRFPNYFYEEELKSKINKIYQLSSTKKDRRQYIDYLLKENTLTSKKIDNEFNDIEKLNIKVKTTNIQIGYLNNILEGTATPEEYSIINQDILTRIRDSIAHSNIRISDINIYDIASTKITFIDAFEGTIEFIGTITLKDLLLSISNKKVIEDSLNNNEHFKKHVLSKRA